MNLICIGLVNHLRLNELTLIENVVASEGEEVTSAIIQASAR